MPPVHIVEVLSVLLERVVTLEEFSARAWGLDEARGDIDLARLLAALVSGSREFIGIADLEGRALFVNEAGRKLVGLPDLNAVQSTRVIDYFAREDQPKVIEQVLPAVRDAGFWEGELNFCNFATGQIVPVLYNIFPVRDSSGKVIAYGTVTRNLTENKIADRQRELLINELNHRVKNTLAIVQSLASQTLRPDGDPEQMKRVFEGRLFALSRAHDLLTQGNWHDADLLDVVMQALSPFCTDARRIAMRGPAVRIAATQIIDLSMALHELATNATKYGALSSTEGRISISWDVEARDGKPLLHLVWSEEGGPTVRQPTRRGFGSRLIERSFGREPDAKGVLDYRAEGLRCAISVCLD